MTIIPSPKQHTMHSRQSSSPGRCTARKMRMFLLNCLPILALPTTAVSVYFPAYILFYANKVKFVCFYTWPRRLTYIGYGGRGGGGGGVERKLFTCPYPLKVQACPPHDQRPAFRSRVSGQEESGIVSCKRLYMPLNSARLAIRPQLKSNEDKILSSPVTSTCCGFEGQGLRF